MCKPKQSENGEVRYIFTLLHITERNYAKWTSERASRPKITEAPILWTRNNRRETYETNTWNRPTLLIRKSRQWVHREPAPNRNRRLAEFDLPILPIKSRPFRLRPGNQFLYDSGRGRRARREGQGPAPLPFRVGIEIEHLLPSAQLPVVSK